LTKSVKILIAGGRGFIGSILHNYLKAFSNVSSIGNEDSPASDFTTLDLTNSNEVNEFAINCGNFDILLFLVGLAHKKGKSKDFPAFEKVNYQTLVNLLSVLQVAGKTPSKIIFASTVSVYGEKYNQNSYCEEMEPHPISPYAVTKLHAEQYLLDNYSTKSWILRFAPVYSIDFLLNINRRTKIGNKFYKIGHGAKKLSLCNIDNIKTTVEGIINGIVPVGVYNISDTVSYSYNDLLNHRGASFVLRIPVLLVRLLYFLGKITKNIFLKENSIKLVTDNIFPSEKIQRYIKLKSTISDLKMHND